MGRPAKALGYARAGSNPAVVAKLKMHLCFNGRIHACQVCDPGSIPGRCTKGPVV